MWSMNVIFFYLSIFSSFAPFNNSVFAAWGKTFTRSLAKEDILLLLRLTGLDRSALPQPHQTSLRWRPYLPAPGADLADAFESKWKHIRPALL